MLLIRRLIGLMVSSLSSVPTTSVCSTVDLRTLTLWCRVVMLSLCMSLKSIFEHLQPLCYPSLSRFLNSLMHLQILSLWFRCSFMPAQSHKSVSWGTPLPWHICWRYYYDPRCLRGSSSNLAMFCVPSVKILAFIIESILWCHLVSRHSIPGFLNPRFTLLTSCW